MLSTLGTALALLGFLIGVGVWAVQKFAASNPEAAARVKALLAESLAAKPAPPPPAPTDEKKPV